MKISLISFSKAGCRTGIKIAESLKEQEIHQYTKSAYTEDAEICHVEEKLNQWAEKQFYCNDALIFIGASGIAVRAIAPFVKSKKTDPAVVVLDEKGKFVISLLSGHLGGANELTASIAEITGGIPVITTATDINRKFAVDVFAKKNHCHIKDMVLAKEISAAIVDGRKVRFKSDFPVKGEIPPELTGEKEELCIYVTDRVPDKQEEKVLYLIPETIVLGVGCRKNTEKEQIQNVVMEACRNEGISPFAFEKAASIDLKKEEQGLLLFTEELSIPFITYTKEELEQVEGEFTESEFVKKVTGVSNVCERSALAEGDTRLIMKKYAKDGVTAAFARKKWSVSFE